MQLATHQRRSIDIWPGFVDALAALLIVITFLLLVFTISQFFLSDALAGKEKTLTKLNQEVAHLAELLSLEQTKAEDVQTQLGEVTAQLADTGAQLSDARQLIARQEQSLAESMEAIAAKQAALVEKNRAIEDKDRMLLERALTITERDQMLRKSAEALKEKDRLLQESGKAVEDRDRIIRERAELLDEQLRAIAILQDDIALLEEARTQLEQEVAALSTRLKDRDEAVRSEQEVSAGAVAQVEVLNRQVKALRDQLTAVSNALGFDLLGHDEDLSDLVKRLNVALVKRAQELAEELALFRSDFFGRLRQVLGDNPDIRIVGDRFVIPSGLLFDSGSAEVGVNGKQQLSKLADILKSVASEIPDDIDWVVRIDGHTDRRPINTPRFPSNWELSAARAISIAKFLIGNGVPAENIAAAGFGEFHPIDAGESPQAYARNRRIEIKLTAR